MAAKHRQAQDQTTPPTQEQITVVHVCTQEHRLGALEEWQIRQNGSLGRIEKKLDRLLFAVLGGSGVIIISLVGYILST